MKSRIKDLLKFLVFLGIGILITWLSLKDLTAEHKEYLLNSFRNANYFWIALVIILGVVSHILRALRWNMLLEPVGDTPSLKNTFLAVMTGYFANLAFPRLGEVTRCGVLLTTDKIPVNKSFGTVITERATDLLLFVILFIILITSQYHLLVDYLDERVFPGLAGKTTSFATNQLLLMMLSAMILFLLILIMLVRKARPEHRFRYKIKTTFLGFWQGLISIMSIKMPWLYIFYSLTIWILYFLMTYLCFRALHETANLSMMAGFAVLIMGSVGIMITPGGIGLYPLIARDTLLLYGISSSTGFAMGWIIWGSQTAMIITTGLFALIWLSMVKRRAARQLSSEGQQTV